MKYAKLINENTVKIYDSKPDSLNDDVFPYEENGFPYYLEAPDGMEARLVYVKEDGLIRGIWKFFYKEE